MRNTMNILCSTARKKKRKKITAAEIKTNLVTNYYHWSDEKWHYKYDNALKLCSH